MLYGYVGKTTEPAITEELSSAIRSQFPENKYDRVLRQPSLLICRNKMTKFSKSVQKKVPFNTDEQELDTIRNQVLQYGEIFEAAGDAVGYNSTLWMFNRLLFVDLRGKLGQVWFVTDSQIFKNAISKMQWDLPEFQEIF